MFCGQCGTNLAEGAGFCAHCGAPSDGSPEESLPTSAVVEAGPHPSVVARAPISQVRPWVRYWARMFDINLVSIVAGTIVVIAYPHALDPPWAGRIFFLFVIFLWVFVEPIFLSISGKTPGKWLLRTRVTTSSGDKVNYFTALSRSFKVWWRGLGIGFPLFSIFTLANSHRVLKKDKITSWDKDANLVVTHERIGAARVTFICVWNVVLLVAFIIGITGNA